MSGTKLGQGNDTVSESPSAVADPASKQTSSMCKKDKVYRKETPQPEMKQLQFPARSATVRPKKTYGKKQRKSLPAFFTESTSTKSGKSKDKDSRQSTLTQIGWVPSTFPEDDDENDPLLVDLTADESDGGKSKSAKPGRRKKAGGGKRRKTMGDLELDADGEGEQDKPPRSSFYTQTLTQMPSWRQSGEDEDDVDDMLSGRHDDDVERLVAESEEARGATPPSKKRKRPSPPPAEGKLAPRAFSQVSVIPQTPSKQRIPPAEIPSSQPSPFTPNLAIERRCWSPLDHTAQGTDRTPLKTKSTNVGAPTPSGNGRALKRTRSEVPDSWSTINGGMSSTPTKKRTPLKDITHMEEMINTGMDQADLANIATQGHNIGAPLQRSQRPADEVVVDSDDEIDMIEDQADSPGSLTPVRPVPAEENPSANVDNKLAEIGTPTPVAGSVKSAVIESVDADKRPTALLVPKTASPQPSSSLKNRLGSTPEPAAEEDETEPETPLPRRRQLSSSSVAEKETPLSSPQKTSPGKPPVSQLGYKSQGFESQRVPFEVIRQMAPQTDRSDVILSIHPDHVKEITDGTKTHEFRNYKIPQTVGRIWIYITRPVCQLKYMATIGDVKGPGEISADDPGIGNKEFNEAKGSKFAYELKQVYQLNNPVSLAQMKENGWVEEAPVRYVYVPPAVLGELLGNLQRALFLEPGEVQPSQMGVTISQEVEEQLRTDLAQSTQLMRIASSPRPPQSKAGKEEGAQGIVPSSQELDMEDDEHIAETPARPTRSTGRQVAFAKPTVPSTSNSRRTLAQIEDSSPLAPGSRPQQHLIKSPLRPSQATTASASSQSQRLSSQFQNHSQRQLRNKNSSSQPLVPVSPPLQKRAPEEQASSSILPDAVEDNILIVDDSPVVQRARGGESDKNINSNNDDHTQSTLGLGLLGSSQGFGLVGGGEQDSLMDDSRIRRPPSEIAWDSDEDNFE